ncbi:MAG: hypothetical protein ABSD49_08975 [Candidatus Bathyarchaeia archaeon]
MSADINLFLLGTERIFYAGMEAHDWVNLPITIEIYPFSLKESGTSSRLLELVAQSPTSMR